MRWIKHPSAYCRSAVVADIRDALGISGYGALWVLLERVAENWDGKSEPELRLPVNEWRAMSGLTQKNLDVLLAILAEHAVLSYEIEERKMRIRAPILLQMQDDWTSRTRRNSEVTPEPRRSASGTETDREPDKEKDSKTHLTGKHLFSVKSVLHRHGIDPGSKRGEALIRYVERMSNQNPGGYLQRTLNIKPEFDPSLTDGQEHSTNNKREGGCKSVGELIQGLGLPRPV